MLEINKIYCMSALGLLKQMPDKSVDLILTDPPYGVNLSYDLYSDTEENWYNLIKDVMPEMIRVGKMVIVQACQIKRLKWFYDNFPPDWIICWYKGSTGCASFIGFNDWEPLLVYGKNNTNMHDYFKVQPTNFDNGHPCPKPIDWARWIIKRATKEDDLVLDCFIGSGTVAIASKQLNRRFIGCDISQSYVDIANKRLQQKTIFNLKEYSEVKSGCDANEDGIPPNNKLLGILPNEL